MSKFAHERRQSAPELLSLVRNVSQHIPEAEVECSVSEEVDVLSRCKLASKKLPLGKTVTFLKENEVCLLPADQEGSSAVLLKGNYMAKALDAISSLFHKCHNTSLNNVKNKVK